MKLSRGARRDNLFCSFFSVSQRLNFIVAWNCLIFVPINPLSLSPVPKFWNPEPAPSPKNFQIWESDSCSDFGYHRCNRNSAMFLPNKCHIWKSHRLLLLKMENCYRSRSGFLHFFYSGAGSERKTQDPAGFDSSTPDTLPIPGVNPSVTLKSWVVGFVFSITACSASALAVAFFHLIEPLSYVRIDILKLLQVSLWRSTVILNTLKKIKKTSTWSWLC